MDYVESMQRVMDFIEDHLEEELNIDQLAETAMLSRFYFQRLFNKLTGVAIMEYVRLRRVARAAQDIKKGNKISDIAFRYGYNSVETFIRSFKSVYGLTPTQYFKSDIPLAHFYKPDLVMKYRMVDMGVPVISSGVLLEMGMTRLDREVKMAGVIRRCRFQPAGQDNPGMAWSDLFTLKSRIRRQSLPHTEFGVSLPGDTPGYFDYLAAVQVEDFDNPEQEFRRFTLPAGQYVLCTFQAEDFYQLTNAALDKAMNYLFHTWLPNSRFEVTGNFCTERYDMRCLKDHPLPQQKLASGKGVQNDPPEMDIMVPVKEKA